ncbi:MAG TPA: PAS domain-containing protein [Erythrobacter sp.]|nr:PAS domain-containing protein [Erythrobacter sp.]
MIDQSVDCVKLLNIAGDVLWMNSNGLCAMEIDDCEAIYGKQWAGLWPEENRGMVADSLTAAQKGETIRFEAFCPTAKGSPRWWNVTVSGVTAPDGENIGFLSVSRDVTEAETQRRALAIAADELRHRLKNAYAMVSGLLSSLAMGNPENEAFARQMNTRLVALSTAQSFFMAPDVPREVGELVPALVQPFVTPACDVCTREIDRVLVSRSVADAIALIVGELAMNSSKHGALTHGGTIAIGAQERNGALVLSWNEVSLQPVAAHSRPGGQGLDLIEMMVDAHRGTITTDWATHGPVVQVRLPITA